jgi:hypothetical protein
MGRHGGFDVRIWTRTLSVFVVIGLVLSLAACGGGGGGGGGGSPVRYDPGAVAVPTGLSAVAGNKEVALNWSPAQNAAAYRIYWSTSPTVDKTTSSYIETTGTTVIVTGLINGTTYYFAVTGVAAYTETSLSGAVPAQPTATAPGLVDLDGIWNFNILVSGQDAGWMQGQVSISSGVVTFLAFLDNTGNTAAPNDVFGTLSVLPDGTISQSNSPTSLVGEISNNTYRDILVGTANWRGNSNLVAVLQKRVRDGSGNYITFNQGLLTGSGGDAGPKFFTYNQISSGAIQEWEFAVGKLGSNRSVKYMGFASSNYATSTFPVVSSFTTSSFYGEQTSLFSVDSTTGVASESSCAGCTAPANYFSGIMSADGTIMVGTFTGAGPKYALRIYQIVNPLTTDYPSPALGGVVFSYDLMTKNYNFQRLAGAGTTGLSAYGTFQFTTVPAPALSYYDPDVVPTGNINYLSYADTSGGALPGPAYFTFTYIGNSNKAIRACLGGILSDPGTVSSYVANTFYGKITRYDYLSVWTVTETGGVPSLTIGMKRP